MDEKRPKRRKDKYNPYTLSEKEGRYFISFRDGQGVMQELQITRELFEVIDGFELDDLSILNEWDRHYEHSELTETTLYNRATTPPESVEDAVFRNLQYEKPCIKPLANYPKHNGDGSCCIILRGLHTTKLQKWRVASTPQS